MALELCFWVLLGAQHITSDFFASASENTLPPYYLLYVLSSCSLNRHRRCRPAIF